MSTPDLRQLRFDDNIESYGQIFDYGWARKLTELSKPAPVLSGLLFDLCISFQGVSTTLAIPRLTVDAVEAYAKGSGDLALSSSVLLRYSKHIIARLEKSHALSSSIENSLLTKMLEWFGEIDQKIKDEEVPFKRQELWDGWVKVMPDDTPESYKTQIRVGIWAAQRLAYSSLFFAYEDFVVQLLTVMGQQDPWPTRKDEFNAACRAVFGEPLTQRCWWATKIETAKLVRHSLAHSGGRVTEKLRGRKTGIEGDGGMLQIMPHNVRELHDELKSCILELSEWAVDKPQFGFQPPAVSPGHG